jgi:cellulase/cellobiase CelA1
MDPSLSTRERYAAHSSLPECASCHRLIDPIGFSFEHFDAVGRWRETEGPHEIDATGEIVATAATDTTFDGLAELSAVLATSSDVESCYVRQWMRFGFGLEEEGGLRCEAERLSEEFVLQGAHLDDILPALTGALHFTERLGDPSEGDAPAAGPFDDPIPDPDPGDDDDDTVGDDDDSLGDDDDDDTGNTAGLIISTAVQSDWGTGYCADVTIENPLSVDVTWQIEVEVEGTISSLWNAQDSPAPPGWVQFVGVSWNENIPPGQSAGFGFCADR